MGRDLRPPSLPRKMDEPAGGEILGRDPIGYLSNDLGLYLFTTNSPLSRLDPRGLDWDSGDFWHHYRTGRGDHVTLTQIGLADDFENLHKSRIDGLVDGGLREGETLAGDCSSGPGSYSKQVYTHLPMEYWNSVTSRIFPDPLFSLGNSGMRISKYLEVNWLCESCCASEGAVRMTQFHVESRFYFRFLDAFTNPVPGFSDDAVAADNQGRCVYNCYLKYKKEVDAGNTINYDKCRKGCQTKFPTRFDALGDPFGISHRFKRSKQLRKSFPCK